MESWEFFVSDTSKATNQVCDMLEREGSMSGSTIQRIVKRACAFAMRSSYELLAHLELEMLVYSCRG
jgi:hypothetical protein